MKFTDYPICASIFIVLLMPLFLSLIVIGQDKWEMANRSIVRLKISSFPQLPRRIKRSLRSRGCTVPQAFGAREPHNVLKGEFTRKGQSDWAVLCSRDRVSYILIFHAGSTSRVSQLATSSDSNYLQTIDGLGAIGFSRVISSVGRAYILAQYREYGGAKPPRIDHQGVSDAFIEKASEVHYYYGGKWMLLQGAD